jgi:hypothetical protein
MAPSSSSSSSSSSSICEEDREGQYMGRERDRDGQHRVYMDQVISLRTEVSSCHFLLSAITFLVFVYC